MNFAEPPNFAQAVWIVGRLAVRRQLNQWQLAGWRRRTTADRDGQRSGTLTKPGRRSIFAGALFVLMVLSGFAISISGVPRIRYAAQGIPASSDKFVVSSFTYDRLLGIDQALQELKKMNDSGERRKLQALWTRHLDSLLSYEIRWGNYSEDQEHVELRRMCEAFLHQGPSGFTHIDNFGLAAAQSRLSPQANSLYLRSMGLLFVIWIPMIVFMGLGGRNKDLGEVEWSLEWLYTFPISARALFVSKLFVYSILDQFVWWLLFPFAVVIYYTAGYGLGALPLGLGVTLYLAVPAGGVSVVSELALRKFLSLDRLKNVQALFTILGSICLLIFYTAMFSAPIIARLISRAGSVPAALTWNPFFLPLMMSDPSLGVHQRELCVLAMIAADLVAVFAALRAAEWLTRDGLIKAGGPYQGIRRAGQRLYGAGWLRGIAAQQLLLLLRDRNLLAQVFIVPLLMPAYYLAIDPHLRSALTGNFRRAAMVTYLVGAFSFIFSAAPLLTRESETLWLLVSFPRSLVSMLRDKVVFWAITAMVYSAAILALLVHFSAHPGTISWIYVLLALYGIALYAFIAAGLGFLSSDVFQSPPQQQVKVGMAYLYLMLTAIYANIFYSASWWTGLSGLVLSTLLAVALWQKVDTIAPYPLDPTQWPARTLSLADGLVAALAFSVAQPVAAFFLRHAALSLTAQVTLAYVAAGIMVAIAAVSILWMQGLPDLWKEIGLVPARLRRTAAKWGLAEGALLGAAAAAAAFGYLHVLDWFPQWQIWKQDAELTSFLAPAAQPFWICALLIVAAPLVEEFLFRGLIFQGLRSTSGLTLAVLGSAALFALLHPPIAVIPVFVLGVAAAVSFERSGFLLAPILTHAVYNGCVLLLNRV